MYLHELEDYDYDENGNIIDVSIVSSCELLLDGAPGRQLHTYNSRKIIQTLEMYTGSHNSIQD